MKNYLLLFVVILFFCFMSCKPKANVDPDIKAFLGSKLLLDGDIERDIETWLEQKSYTMIIYLDAKECVPCSLQSVIMLKNHKELFDSFDMGVLLVIKDNNNKKEIEELLKTMNIGFPFVFDSYNCLIENNKPINNIICHNFILDKELKVIWIGSPIRSDKALESYKKMMNKIIKKD